MGIKMFKKTIARLSHNAQLLYHFAVRELKIRYKSPVLGFLWMFFLPLSLVVIFKIIFSNIVKVSIPEYPFFIFLTLGVFPWNYLGMSISGTVNSLVDNEALLKKVYFPREIIPLSLVFGNLINFIISNVIILALMVLLKIPIGKFVIFLPFVIILETIFIVGLVLIFSSFQVYYRDVKYLTEILLLFWFYISPVFYPLRLVADVSDKFFKIYLLNPLVHIITLYRLVYLKDYLSLIPRNISIPYLIIYPTLISVLTFSLGFLLFSKLEKQFTDYI